MRRSPLLAAGLGLLLACRPTPPPKPPDPPPSAQPLAPWSWYHVGGILVVEGEVERPTDLFLQGRTWRESRACEMGPVRWEMYRPRDDEPAELRDGSGRLLARWDFRKPWQPAPVAKPPAPNPEPAKPPVSTAVPEPVPAPVVQPRPAPKPEPMKPPAPKPEPVPPKSVPPPPSNGFWERVRGWFGGSSPAPKPVPPPAAPKPELAKPPAPQSAPKPIPPPAAKPLPAPKPLVPPAPAPKAELAKPVPAAAPVPKPVPPPSKGLWERIRGWFGGSAPKPEPLNQPQAPAPKPVPPPAPKPEPLKPQAPAPKPVPPPAPKPEPLKPQAPAPKPVPPPAPKPEPLKPQAPAPKPVPPPAPKPEPPKPQAPVTQPAPPPSRGFWERIRGWFGGSSPQPAAPPKPVPPPVAQPRPVPKPEPPIPAPPARPEPVKPPAPLPTPKPTPPKPEPVKPAVPAPAPKPEPPRPAVPSRTLPLWVGAGDGFNLLRGASGQKRICLTFDGGSAAEVAPEVLDALRKHRIRTTIFLTGAFIRTFPELVKRIVAEGHEVGNHTMNHPHLAPNFRRDPAWTRERFQEELLAADRAFQALVGRPMDPLWRAPYGEHTLEIRKWAEELGYRHVGWSEGADTLDWATVKERKLYRTGEKILERLDQRTARPDGDGLIVLMHLGSGRPEEDRPSRSLGRFIEAKRKAGWSFVPASQYLKDSGKVVWDSAARAALLARGMPGPG